MQDDKKNKKLEKKSEGISKTQAMCIFFSIFAMLLSILTFALCTYKYFNKDISGNETPNNNNNTNNNTNNNVNQANITSRASVGLKSFNQVKEIN